MVSRVKFVMLEEHLIHQVHRRVKHNSDDPIQMIVARILQMGDHFAIMFDLILVRG